MANKNSAVERNRCALHSRWTDGLNFFWPKLSVTIDAPFDPSLPLTIPVILTNDGISNFDELYSECHLNHMLFKGDNKMDGNHLSPYPPPTFLKSGDRTTFLCAIESGIAWPQSDFIMADMSVLVAYRIGLVPWRFQHQSRFVTTKTQDGTIRWVQMNLRDGLHALPYQ